MPLQFIKPKPYPFSCIEEVFCFSSIFLKENKFLNPSSSIPTPLSIIETST